jgi:hypothetical protein
MARTSSGASATAWKSLRWLIAYLKRHVSLRIAEDLNRITYIEISQLARHGAMAEKFLPALPLLPQPRHHQGGARREELYPVLGPLGCNEKKIW